MSKIKKLYQVVSLALVFTMMTTVIPLRVWQILGQKAVIAQAATTPVTPMTQLLEPQGASMLSDLPPELSEQLGGLELFSTGGEPNGMLMDVSAIQGLAATVQTTLQQPASLQNPLSVSRTQSTYSAEAALNNTLLVTFTVTNNQPPVSFPEIDPNATVTETLELVANLDFNDDPNTIHNILLTDELLPSVTTLLDISQASDRSNDSYAWNLGDLALLALSKSSKVI